MKTAAFIFLISCTSAMAQIGATAESITVSTSGGLAVLKHCKVTKIDPDGVRVMHDAGMAKVPYEFMPEGWLLASGIDRERAKAYREGFRDAMESAAISTPATPTTAPAAKPAADGKAKLVSLSVHGAVIKNKRSIPEGCVPIRPLTGGVILVEGNMSTYANNPRFEATVYPTGKSHHYDGAMVPVYSLTPPIAAN
jgi:hypothetical protein